MKRYSVLIIALLFLPQFVGAGEITNCVGSNGNFSVNELLENLSFSYTSSGGTSGYNALTDYSYSESGTIDQEDYANISGSLNQIDTSNLDCYTYNNTYELKPILTSDRTDIILTNYGILSVDFKVDIYQFSPGGTFGVACGPGVYVNYFSLLGYMSSNSCGTLSDGDYQLVYNYSSSGGYNPIPFYVIGGKIYLDVPSDTSVVSTVSSETKALGSLNFGIGLLLLLAFVSMIAYVYNLMTSKKPWHS